MVPGRRMYLNGWGRDREGVRLQEEGRRGDESEERLHDE